MRKYKGIVLTIVETTNIGPVQEVRRQDRGRHYLHLKSFGITRFGFFKGRRLLLGRPITEYQSQAKRSIPVQVYTCVE